MLNENRVKHKVLNDDVVIFRRHDRMYRLSNLAHNWLPGKLFVLINANTTDQKFEAADRINLLSHAAELAVRSSSPNCGNWKMQNSSAKT